MPILKVNLDKNNFASTLHFKIDGKRYSFQKSTILAALFSKYKFDAVFHSNTEYDLELPVPDQTPNFVKVKVILNKDLIYRKRINKNKKVPKVIFKPIYVNRVNDEGIETRKRQVVAQIIYTSPDTHQFGHARYSVLPSGAARKLIKAKASGSFGRVYAVEATLAPDMAGNWLFKTNKQRMLKVQEHSEEKIPLRNAIQEVQYLHQMGHISSKDLTVVNDEFLPNNHFSYFVQEEAQGISLREFLSQIRTITILQRYQISLALIIFLQEQVHNRGVVHRDIKPDNIFIKLPEKSSPDQLPLITYIDAGLSKDIFNLEVKFFSLPKSYF